MLDMKEVTELKGIYMRPEMKFRFAMKKFCLNNF